MTGRSTSAAAAEAFSFPVKHAGLTARHVRLQVTTPANNGNTAARIYELEAYGP